MQHSLLLIVFYECVFTTLMTQLKDNFRVNLNDVFTVAQMVGLTDNQLTHHALPESTLYILWLTTLAMFTCMMFLYGYCGYSILGVDSLTQ